MIKKLTELKLLAESILPNVWVKNNKHDICDVDDQIIASCRFEKHASFIEAVSPSNLNSLLKEVLEVLTKRKRYVIAMNELKQPMYFSGIECNDIDGIGFVCTNKLSEAISFHDLESAKRFAGSMNVETVGIKTKIIALGDDNGD